MKRILPLFLTLSVAPIVYADAPTAPAPAVAPAPDPAPVVDPAASVLLEKSSQAYTTATGLTLKYTSSRVAGDATVDGSGTVSFVRPDQARIETKTGDRTIIVVADSEKLWQQMPTATSASYRVQPAKGPLAMASALSAANGGVGFMLSNVLSGRNLLKIGYVWENVTALPNNTVKMVGHLGKDANPPKITMTVSFDPATNLISKTETSVTSEGKTTVTTATFTDVKANPDFTPGTFNYVPGPDVKEYVQPPMYDPKLVVGAEPYALKGNDLDGNPSDWSKYKGKVVLLDFWATWCGPCKGELPNVYKNYGTYHDKGFDIIGVSLDDSKDALLKFLKDNPSMSYPNLFDGKGWQNVNSTSYGVQAIPFSLLIGKDGKIAAVNPRGEKLEPAIQEALAK